MEIFMSPVFVFAILCLNILISKWLIENTFLKPLSAVLLVIIVTAIVANLNIIPSASDNYPLYNGIFTYIAPLSVFYLLLEVSLKNLKQAGLPMLIMFLVGSLGTVIGVLVSVSFFRGETELGQNINAIAGMFTGTYTGGSVNFNAVALHYKVMENGPLYAGAVAVDNILTAIWMVVTLALPRILGKWLAPKKMVVQANSDNTELNEQDRANISPGDLAILLTLGTGALWLSNTLAALFSNMEITIPSILILTTIALILAQLRWIQKLKGTRLLGMFSIFLFLAVIGAYCELAALGKMGEMALSFLIFVSALVFIHGIVIYGIGALLRWDWVMISVASQANVGGSSSALALAKTLGRSDLMLPAILVGSLGNGLGTYLGFLVAGII